MTHPRTWSMVLLVIALVSAIAVLAVVLVFGRTQTSEMPLTPTPAHPSAVPPTAPTTLPEASAALPPVIIQPTPSPETLTYVVREGDTLSGIAHALDVSVEALLEANDLADPNLLYPGQTLLIPVLPQTTTATPDALTDLPADEPQPTPLPTPTSVGPPLVEIWGVNAPGELLSEMVTVGNSGGLASLSGWTLSDNEGNVFVFPALVLFTGGEVRVHSRPGTSLPSDLYWGRAKPAWSRGELITLCDIHGEVVDTYIIP